MAGAFRVRVERFLEWLAPVWRPHPGQREFLLAQAPRKVLACGRRWGKTDACAVDVLHRLATAEGAVELLLAPTAVQAGILFRRILELLEAASRLPPGRFRLEMPQIRWSPHPHLEWEGYRLSARSGHRGDSLRGQGATHITVDEAAYVPVELIEEVAMPMLATSGGGLTQISTPNGLNHFWRSFRRGLEGRFGFWSRAGPTSENPAVSPEFLLAQREMIAERAFRTQYEAEFLDASGAVFGAESLEAAFAKPFPDPLPEGPVGIGIDLGRYRDYTAIAVLVGDREAAWLVHLERLPHVSHCVQREWIAEVLRRYPGARVACDSTGSGDTDVEELGWLGLPVALEGIKFNQLVKRQLIERLGWGFAKGALALRPNATLREELEAFAARERRTGSILLAASGSAHDDMVVALALAYGRLHTPYHGGPVRLGEMRTY